MLWMGSPPFKKVREADGVPKVGACAPKDFVTASKLGETTASVAGDSQIVVKMPVSSQGQKSELLVAVFAWTGEVRKLLPHPSGEWWVTRNASVGKAHEIGAAALNSYCTPVRNLMQQWQDSGRRELFPETSQTCHALYRWRRRSGNHSLSGSSFGRPRPRRTNRTRHMDGALCARVLFRRRNRQCS